MTLVTAAAQAQTLPADAGGLEASAAPSEQAPQQTVPPSTSVPASEVPDPGAADSEPFGGSPAGDEPPLTFGATAEVERPPGPGETAYEGTASRSGIPLEEMPVTMNTMKIETVQQRGAGDLNEALYYVPGLNPVWRYGGFQQIRSRGFRAIVLNDGRRDDRATFVNSHPQGGLWDLERIEVLKGPSAALYGYGSVGGMVNLIRKRPSPTEAYELDVALGTPGQRRAHVGATGPIAEGFNYRVDLGHTYERNFRGYVGERNQGTLTLAFSPEPDHRFFARAAVYQDFYNTDAGIPTEQVATDRWQLPPGTKLENRYNTPQDFLDYLRVDLETGWEWQLTDDLELRERFSYTYDLYEYFSTEGLEYDDNDDDPLVNRTFYFYFFHHWQPVQNQLELHADVTTGPIRHRALVGYDFTGMFDGHSDRSSNIFDETIDALDFHYPVETQSEVPIEIDNTRRGDMMAHSLFAQDHVSLPANFKVLLGGRVDFFSFEARRDELDPQSGAVTERGPTDSRNDTVFTYRAGAVYDGLAWLIPYASWSTAFRPNSSLGINTDTDGDGVADFNQEPEHGQQLEAGLRLRSEEGLSLDLAAYQIWKTHVTYSQPMGEINTAGEVTSRGIEVDVHLDLDAWLRLTAGYAYTDAEFQQFEADGEDLSGNVPAFVPNHTASLWAAVSPIDHFGVALGGRVMGDQYADNENTLKLERYVLADAAVWHRSGPLTFTVTVNNVLDQREYFVSSIGKQLTPGSPRRVLAQMNATF